MKLYSILFLAVMILFLSSCKKDEVILRDSGVKLSFTTDTVMFDTVFTKKGSVTKRFLVHNDYKQSLQISSISLGSGENSPFRMNVDGESGTSIKDYTVAGGDSFYIFVDVTINPNGQNQPFVIKDSIVFVTNGTIQDVKLIAWGQDAHYLKDSVIDYNATWTNDKPYVIYNSILIRYDKTLTIQPGVKIHSYGKRTYDVEGGKITVQSTIYVEGTLIVNGTVDEPVKMQGTRLEQYYKDAAGQWGGIRILPKSKDNYFKNLFIRNADFGIEVDSLPVNYPTPNLILENVRIENMGAACLLGKQTKIQAYNCLFDNSCQYLVYIDYGGEYEFYHCTFAHSSCQCTSRYPAMAFYNTDFKTGSVSTPNNLVLKMVNSIVYGDLYDQKKDEIEYKATGTGTITIAIENTLLETAIPDLNINNNLINKDPLFSFPCKYNYKLDTLSFAVNTGRVITSPPDPVNVAAKVGFDIEGKPRNVGKPDLGAFERQQ